MGVIDCNVVVTAPKILEMAKVVTSLTKLYVKIEGGETVLATVDTENVAETSDALGANPGMGAPTVNVDETPTTEADAAVGPAKGNKATGSLANI